MMTFRKFAAIACTVAVAGTFISCNSLDDDDLGITEQTITLTVVPQALSPPSPRQKTQKARSGKPSLVQHTFSNSTSKPKNATSQCPG